MENNNTVILPNPRSDHADLADFLLAHLGPILYGALIGNGTNPTGLTIGYIIGGVVMILEGLVEVAYGINAEDKALEDVARTAQPGLRVAT